MPGRIKEETLKLNMVVNGSPAQKELITLEMATKDLKKANADLKEELKAVSRAKVFDAEKHKQLTAEINKNNAAIKQNETKMHELRKEIGITGLTMNQLNQRARELRAQINNMTPGNPLRKKLVSELEQINAQMTTLRVGAAKTKLSLGGIADGFNRYFGMIGAFAASFTGVILGFRKLVDTANQYGESVANLSALTGLAGDDLNWLSDQAKNLTKNGTESGIKITASAQQIVDSYTKMGSAKPELLKNKEALDSVTQQALVLAEAAKMDAAPAVEGLATVMNQFSAPASEAAKYVNVLAAGSKEGAAEVTDIKDSIVKFGAAANSANVSVEQSVAMIETLSEKGIKGEIAGTALKTMLVRLQKGADEFNPKIVGMSQALENLGNANLSTAQMAEMFGTESLVQAQIIIENRKRFNELTTAVTGTNVAMDQAKINTDTNAAALKRAQNAFQLTAIELGEKLAPALTFSTSGFSYLLKAVMWSIDAFRKYGPFIIGASAAIGYYTIAVNASAIATKTKYYWTLLAEKAEKMLQATTKTNIWAAVGALIIGASVALAAYIKRLKEIPAAQKIVNEVTDTANKNIVEEKLKLEQLLTIAKDRHKTLKDRRDAIEEINKISPEYLGNITLENINTKESIKATEDYIKALERKALMQAAQEKLVEIEKDRIDALRTNSDFELSFWQKAGAALVGYGNSVSGEVIKSSMATKNSIEANRTYKEQKEALLKILNSSSSIISDETKALDSNTNATGRNSKSKKEKFEYEQNHLKELLYEYEKFNRNLAAQNDKADLQEYAQIDNKFIELSEKSISYYADEHEKLKKALEEKKITKAEFDTYDKNNESDLQKELLAIQEWNHKEKLEAAKKYAKEESEKQKDQDKQSAEERKQIIKQLEDRVNEITGASLNERLAMTEMEYAKLIQIAQEKGIDITKIEEELQKKLKEIKDQYADAKKDPIFGMTDAQWDDLKKKFSDISGLVNALGNTWKAYYEYKNAKADAELQKDEVSTNKKKENLKKQLDSGFISQKEYDEKIQVLDDEMEQKKKKAALEAAKRERNARLFDIIMNTAAGVVESLPNYYLAAAVAATGAIQTATVLATPLPQVYTGNYEQVIGAQDGKTYNAKRGYGSGYFSTPTIHNNNKLVAERGPELVFSAPDTRRILNTPGMIDAINYSIGRFPQYASGNYDTLSAGFNGNKMLELLDKLDRSLSGGIRSYVVADESYVDTHQTAVKKTDTIRKQTSG